ncbi:mucoidy inhibitor MuiA family protein [Pasteurella testudinis]|uniref:mucoidy inhibitor MuiA family protein n=1 Tax=Pasteurella testudinis TaxID=761 RepID=UPI0040594102
MKKTILTLIAAMTALCAAQAMSATTTLDSAIRQVVLYQNQAKVERTAEVQLSAGTHELVFEHLPLSLEANSLQFSAQGTHGLTVLSLDSEVRSEEQHSASLLRELQQQIRNQEAALKQTQDQMAAVENQFQLLQWLQHGHLNRENSDSAATFEDFSRLQQFSNRTFNELASERRTLSEKIQRQQQGLDDLQRQYQRLGGDQGLQQRVVRVQVQAAEPVKQTVNLSYTTPNASWRPQYQLNYNSADNRVSLQYGAKIRQSSNEDWYNVKLVLSSANPIQVGEVPEVTPWLIDFYQPPQFGARGGFDRQLQMAAPMAAGKSAMAESAVMDSVQSEPQQALVQSGIVASRFEIAGSVNLVSSRSEQNVVISQLEQPASAEYAFYPDYQQTVLLTVSGKNNHDYPLLAGNLRTAYDGDVIGSGYLPTLLPDDEFKQLIGEDQTISVTAEAPKRTEERGGLINKTKKVRLETAYTLQNNRAQAVDVVVYDRLPQAVNQEITVKILQPELNTVSVDDSGRYQQKISLPPHGKQTVKKVFTLEYPQDKTISGL